MRSTRYSHRFVFLRNHYCHTTTQDKRNILSPTRFPLVSHIVNPPEYIQGNNCKAAKLVDLSDTENCQKLLVKVPSKSFLH